MRSVSRAVRTLALVGLLVPAAAQAQTSNIELRPPLTQEQFEQFAADLGSMLRFRQPGDATMLERGTVDLSVQFANARFHDSRPFPQVVARFGVNRRLDIGAWGGIDPNANYGMVGVDTKIALLREGPSMPVSVTVRPSLTSLVGPSDVWAGNVSVDLAVSRAIGSFTPYGGVAASSSGAIERSSEIHLDPVSAGTTVAYAGTAYRWRSLLVSGEIERGNETTYAVRVGKRF